MYTEIIHHRHHYSEIVNCHQSAKRTAEFLNFLIFYIHTSVAAIHRLAVHFVVRVQQPLNDGT